MIGPLAYVGGKRRIAKRLIKLFPKHTTYVEAFAGGAQVFFAKEPSEVEVLNDLDGDVINFFRVCQAHSEELVRYLRFTIASRRLFDLYAKTDPATLTDIQRAGRFLYLQKNGFGGNVARRSYHFCVTQKPNFNPGRLKELIRNVAARLSAVQLESEPYEAILEKFDRPSTLFFLDPPYVGARLYNFNFADEDFGRLANRLSGIRGKFLLTINDHPLSREVFANFHVREIEVVYSVARSVPKVRELIVTNYDLTGDTMNATGSLGDKAA